MNDMQAQADKLRCDAAECALIRDLATDPKKRELFSRLADHLAVLAAEVERAMQTGDSEPIAGLAESIAEPPVSAQ